MCALMRNISFCRSCAVSTVFGVNWATSATKVTWAGMTNCGSGVEHEPDLGAQLDAVRPPSVGRKKVM